MNTPAEGHIFTVGTMARCGRTDPHGGHAYPAGVGPDGRSDGRGKSGFCGGNQNVITAVVKCPVDGCMGTEGHDSFGPEDGWHLSINNTSFRDPSDPYSRAIAYATDLGTEHGKNAASWYMQGIDGLTASTILIGIESGDPAILDRFPQPDLSGEWADTMSGPELMHKVLWTVLPDSPDPSQDDAVIEAFYRDCFTDICDAYETAFSLAAEAEIVRMARYQID